MLFYCYHKNNDYELFDMIFKKQEKIVIEKKPNFKSLSVHL